MKTAKNINKSIAYGKKTGRLDTNLISDTYHTFGELYAHRGQLFITLCNYLGTFTNKDVWKSWRHHDGSSWNGWFIAGINHAEGEQLSYHLPLEKFYDLHVPEIERAPLWDGHTPADVLERLKSL